MHMRFPPEVTHHVRPLQLPHIPNFILPHILLLIKSHVNIVQASGLNQLESFLGILLPKRSQQIPQHLANVPLLISACLLYTSDAADE